MIAHDVLTSVQQRLSVLSIRLSPMLVSRSRFAVDANEPAYDG